MTFSKEDINEYLQVKIEERESIAKALSKCDKRTYRYRYLRELYQHTQGVIEGLNTLFNLDKRRKEIKCKRVYDYEFDEKYEENE